MCQFSPRRVYLAWTASGFPVVTPANTNRKSSNPER
jgi:hypothetical protein